MARRGRPAKIGVKRYASGAAKKPTVAERAEAERVARLGETVTVLSQPHRRGDASQMRGCALGRFVLDLRLRREFFDAGESYGNLIRRLFAAKGVPLAGRLGDGGLGNGLGPSDALVRRWQAEDDRLRRHLHRVGPMAVSLIRDLCVYDVEADRAFSDVIVRALSELAVETGFLRAGEHPFEHGARNSQGARKSAVDGKA